MGNGWDSNETTRKNQQHPSSLSKWLWVGKGSKWVMGNAEITSVCHTMEVFAWQSISQIHIVKLQFHSYISASCLLATNGCNQVIAKSFSYFFSAPCIMRSWLYGISKLINSHKPFNIIVRHALGLSSVVASMASRRVTQCILGQCILVRLSLSITILFSTLFLTFWVDFNG